MEKTIRQKTTANRRSVSLIEIIVAMVILSLVTAGLSISIAKHSRRIAFNKTCDRLEKMCFQAYRFSAINVHATNVIIQKEKDQWEAYVSLWGNNDIMRKITQNCSDLKDLRSIRAIRVNGQNVSGLTLQFFGSEGLALITGIDEYGHPLKHIDFIHIVEGKEVKTPEIIIESDLNDVQTRSIPLQNYLSSPKSYLSFPNEYTHDD
jgi:type II secretory pathway pseudopilin PulG